jgi:hypothetical protein
MGTGITTATVGRSAVAVTYRSTPRCGEVDDDKGLAFDQRLKLVKRCDFADHGCSRFYLGLTARWFGCVGRDGRWRE